MRLTIPFFDKVFKNPMEDNRKAFSIIVIISLLAVMPSFAITKTEARHVAEMFISQRHASDAALSRGKSSQSRITLKTIPDTPQGLYAFNAGSNGFILVSDNGEIIGYSDSGTLDWHKIPEALKDWTAVICRHPENMFASSTRASSRNAVAPMITTEWHQTEPYNAFCPDGAVTGCVATAVAQVMAYHRWPQEDCKEIPAYSSYGSLPPTSFCWQQMKPTYSAEGSDDTHTAIAQLMRYCGRAVQTVYSSVSFAYEFRIPTALKTYFGYDASVRRVVRSDYNIADWDEMIYEELASGRPVIYSGQRTRGTVHEFVIDGYDGKGYYHVNWGWGGLGNGFFLLPALTPGETSTGGGSGSDGYTMDQSAVIGIKPDTGGEAISYQYSLTVEDFGLMNDTTVYHRKSIDDPFTVDIRNVQGNHSNKSLGCYPGLGLYQGDTKIGVMPGSFTTYDPGSFTGKHWDGIYRYVPYNLIFGAGMKGNYRLIPVCGQGGLVMVTWKPSIGADTHYIDVELTDTTLTLTEHPSRILKISSVNIESQSDTVMVGKVTVTNNGDEFNGKLYLQVNGKFATGTGTAIAENKTSDVTFHFISKEDIHDFRIGFWPDGDSWLCEGTGTSWKAPEEPEKEQSIDVTIENVLPGELGKEILNQANNLRDVVSLTIKAGTLNDNDFNLLYNTLHKVRAIDLYGISNTYFPRAGSDVYGFRNCDSLRSIRLPRDLDRLTDRYSDSYGELFRNCRYLESIDIPAGVRMIPGYLFQDCDRLREVIFNEGLEFIGEQAFGGCDSLRTVTLPASLVQADGAFRGCDNLNEITSLAPAPPILKEYDLFGYGYNNDWDIENVDIFMKGRILTSPKSGNYTLAQGWNRFQRFEWSDNEQKDIRICSEWNLLNELPEDKPNVTLGLGMDDASRFWYAGHMSVNTDKLLSLGTFNIEQDALENNTYNFLDPVERVTYQNSNTRDKCWPTLLTNAPMRADTVRTTLRWHSWSGGSGGTIIWSFASLPFDTKLKDLRVTRGGKGLQWSIMKYSGYLRSKAEFNDVWIKQTADSIIHAGEGFIIAVGWDDVKDMYADLTFTAINNENKNRLFTTSDLSIPLKQYTAAAACDRSWNYIGNPYPCFFSTKYLDPAAPFVVYDREKRRYQVYSPIDDDYVLRPFEGFFIQKPLGYDEIDFPRYGRFQTIAEYEAWKKDMNSSRRKAPMTRAANANRRVHNIQLSGEDKCRLVVNPEAAKDYEAGCDAIKFPNHDGTNTLLYIIGADDTRYAISEQPFAEGDTLRLGAFFVNDGEYTLVADSTLTLLDSTTGMVHRLNEPYTFSAKTGEDNGRFSIVMSNPRKGYVKESQMVTINDVTYNIQAVQENMHIGQALVLYINSTTETVEIPAFITYDGEQYEVYSININSALGGNPLNEWKTNETVKHIILPSTITDFYSDFTSETLQSITLHALTPPTMNGNPYGDNNVKLYVPKAAVNDYKTTYPYWDINSIRPATTDADFLSVNGSNVMVDDSSKPSGKPSLDIHRLSGLTIDGSKSISLDGFCMEYPFIGDLWRNGRTISIGNIKNPEDNAAGTLVNSSPVTADKVSVMFYDRYGSEYTYFFCLPFNVRVADIIDDREEGKIFLYRYNSAQRAEGQYGNNWQAIGADETIKAGEGFIMNTRFSGYRRHFTFPALDDAKKNDIFASSHTVTLTNHPAAKAEDRGWNLVGNMYPAYYDMSQSDLQQPYQIYGQYEGNAYTDRHYMAYTRDDDDILLRPFEGFFVQYTDTQKSFSMPGKGRWHGYPEFIYEKTYSKGRALTRAAEENRQLYDIELTGDSSHDRTRIVINPGAKADFEPQNDAIKLDGNDVTSVYTLEGQQRLAINERPATDNGITLVANITAAGNYTLSLGKHNAEGIVLTDMEMGISTQLDTDSYTFAAKAGARRFSVSFGNSTGVSEEIRVKSEESTAPVYDLQGRKVEGKMKPGVYVRNGKKIVVR